jgi:ubiquinone/menaquinone biosynthesis C-methylase UbiE
VIAWWWRFVRFGFHLLYNQFAWTYDAVALLVSAGEWRAWQRAGLAALNLPSGAYILEVAHGTGNLHIDLHRAGYRAVGIDFSRAMGRIASGKLRRADLAPNLVRASASALPFPASHFDGLICTFPSEFLAQPGTLTEFYRVLAPEGRCAVVLHGVLLRGWWRPFLDVLFQATGQGGINQDRVPPPDELNARYLRLIAAFTAAGLDCEIIPMLTPKGYAVVAVGGRMPQ